MDAGALSRSPENPHPAFKSYMFWVPYKPQPWRTRRMLHDQLT